MHPVECVHQFYRFETVFFLQPGYPAPETISGRRALRERTEPPSSGQIRDKITHFNLLYKSVGWAFSHGHDESTPLPDIHNNQ